MNNSIKILLICLAVISCHNKKDSDILITGSLPDSKAEYQKLIVGQLSGKYSLGNGTRIKSRWSKDEREITKQYLKELLASITIEPEEHPYKSPNLNPAIDLILDPYKGTNVYGILPSTNNSKEYIVLGAHYDTGKRNAPGAIDNATGIALIYSVTKELLKNKQRNKNVLIVFFDQEEEELIGSKAFADFLAKKEWNIHSVHCFDMVGWDGNNDEAMEAFSASDPLLKVYQKWAKNHTIPLKTITINPVGYDKNNTDFDAFVPNGFNVIGAGECVYHGDYSPYKDTSNDTFETVDFQYLLACSNLIQDIITELVEK